jgi:hypothetical protein
MNTITFFYKVGLKKGVKEYIASAEEIFAEKDPLAVIYPKARACNGGDPGFVANTKKQVEGQLYLVYKLTGEKIPCCGICKMPRRRSVVQTEDLPFKDLLSCAMVIFYECDSRFHPTLMVKIRTE